MRGLLRTQTIGATTFQLNGHMPDAEAIVQLILDLNQQRIVDLSIWLYEMRCKRDLRRAHGPNVEIVDSGNAGQFGEIIFDGSGINTGRYGGQRG